MDALFADRTTESRGFKIIIFPIKTLGNDESIDILPVNTLRVTVSTYE